MKMLNNLLKNKGYPAIKVGIGLSTSQELVVKAGRYGTGINNKVWIGDAVTKAANLSSLGNRDGYKSIIFSNCSYINMIDILENNSKEARSWFTQRVTHKHGTFYDANIIKTDFNSWVDNGMPD